MINYINLCLINGNGTIRTTITGLAVVALVGGYLPITFIESL